jgi:hypothetical protein
MPLFFFQIGHGDYSGFSENDLDAFDRDAAWAEMTKVCADLIGSVACGLKEDSEWQINLFDYSKKPLFRIRLVAETVD